MSGSFTTTLFRNWIHVALLSTTSTLVLTSQPSDFPAMPAKRFLLQHSSLQSMPSSSMANGRLKATMCNLKFAKAAFEHSILPIGWFNTSGTVPTDVGTGYMAFDPLMYLLVLLFHRIWKEFIVYQPCESITDL